MPAGDSQIMLIVMIYQLDIEGEDAFIGDVVDSFEFWKSPMFYDDCQGCRLEQGKPVCFCHEGFTFIQVRRSYS